MNDQILGQTLARPGGLRPLPSLAGFWPRALAFLIDIVFLHFLFRSLIATTGDFVFDNPRLARILSAVLMLGYFVVMNGPIGKGCTLGKMILDLRVTDESGVAISWIASLKRTAVQLPYALIAFFALTFFAQEEPTPRQFWMQNMMTVYLGMAWSFGTIIACALNPYRQGFHDFAAGTLVRKRKEEVVTLEALQTTLGVSAERLHVQPQRSGAISVVLIWIAMGVLTWGSGPTFSGAEDLINGVREMEQNPALQKGRFSTMFVVPDPNQLAVPEDSETTGTTAPAMGDRRVAVVNLSKLGMWQGDPEDAGFRAVVENAADRYLQLLEQFNPGRQIYQGEVTIRVKVQSYAPLALVRPTRTFAEFEFPGRTVHFQVPETTEGS